MDVKVLYDPSWSDHLALEVKCSLNALRPHYILNESSCNKVIWGNRDSKQIDQYHKSCNEKLRDLDFPFELSHCCDAMCDKVEHRSVIDKMYSDIIHILCKAAVDSFDCKYRSHKKCVVGWNRHVYPAHREARVQFQLWCSLGRPRSGPVYDKMTETRRIFKSKLKWCQNNAEQVKMDVLAIQHTKKNFKSFWKETSKLNPRPYTPLSVDGFGESLDIANMFVSKFKVVPSDRPPVVPRVLTAVAQKSNSLPSVSFSAKGVASTISKMTRGKSPGHDGISIEHLRHAGVHLPRVLAMFFTFCLRHSYVPDECTKAVVVPVIKNKTGDPSDSSNYRPISLATTIAKVLDSMLDQQLCKHLKISDAQFGFRAGLSTETAILCLKHTVRYYTDRRTPVYGCFLDLSRAFDLVSYDRLWEKLRSTSLPEEIISVFDYWYSNQVNVVRWANVLSDEYRLECGVRQGGLTSPRLFNLYINELIEGLSSTSVGCTIDGTCINNISYADDMVLLSPSISGLRKLVGMCEEYAVTHGLRYNAKKSELLVFQPRNVKVDTVPSVKLNGTPLNRVTQVKYLGHWVTEDLADDMDVERERRALAVRGNMLARRFKKCSGEVKCTMFRAYCLSFYSCALWVSCTQRALSALRVQYNNVLRMLLGLPRFCSASGMFLEARIDGFHAILRKRAASLLHRVRASSNSILRVIADRLDSPFLRHWIALHVSK
ncbi:hypothetical protein PYW08_007298 [Mythimna loreyi]|uniref:Uncharacterized protein n=1 Tax=Mythimna loreyi TaxID=667449 RepID=A0ACC2R9X5_9NEOP|nr:hypothetical protein PYW08_007298 [Mythimna loreyi]